MNRDRILNKPAPQSTPDIQSALLNYQARVEQALAQSLPATHESPKRLHEAMHYARSEERRVGKECRSRWSPYR